ncbi:MAG: hypothetical protein H6Q68_916 [Firmicutes bacterium]|nr:hypothetical protein [Bacillota bacterium]
MPNIKSLGKLYFYFIISGGFIFLIERLPNAGSAPIDNSIISSAIYSIQSLLGNIELKRILLTVLLLATLYVAMETLVFLRECAAILYFKYKKNNVIEE